MPVVGPDGRGEPCPDQRRRRIPRGEGRAAGSQASQRQQSLADQRRCLHVDLPGGERTLGALDRIEGDIEDIVEHHPGGIERPARGGGQKHCRPRLEGGQPGDDEIAGEDVGDRREVIRQPQQSRPGEPLPHARHPIATPARPALAWRYSRAAFAAASGLARLG